jgi:Ca2+/Na+ antiporter
MDRKQETLMNTTLRNRIVGATLLSAFASTPALAWDSNTLSSALGGGIGGALGAAIGNEIGGNNGALIGSAVGAAGGTLITNRNNRDDDYDYRDDRRYRYDASDYGRYSRYDYRR